MTPVCAPCALVVDWLQNLYESDFVVNEETGETIRGAYLWAPEGAEVLTCPHVFGAAAFLDPEDRRHGKLGDQFQMVRREPFETQTLAFTKRKQIKGTPSECCGESPYTALALTEQLRYGLPSHCYPEHIAGVPWWAFEIHVTGIMVRNMWLRGLYYLDNFDSSKESDIVSLFLDLDSRFTGFRFYWSEDGSGAPRWMMYSHPESRGIMIGGTRTNQDLLGQIFGSAVGPVHVGKYYSLRQWFDSAETLRAELADFAGPHRTHTYCAGFSQGAAIAANIIATESTDTNREQWELMTFGAPRFGNSTMYRLLPEVFQTNFQLDNDPVPSLPPGYPNLIDLYPIVGPLSYFFWQRWAPPKQRTVVDQNGFFRTETEYFPPDFPPEYLASLLAIGAALPNFEEHDMEVYHQRLYYGL